MRVSRIPVVATLLLLFPVLLWSEIARCQSTVTVQGIVVDAETGTQLVGANVVVSSGDLIRGVATGDDGRFRVADLPAGEYRVAVSYIGYVRAERQLRLDPGETRDLRLNLVPADIRINPLTVTASRSPERLLDAPAAITVLEHDEIESRAALTAAEHLKSAPSVDLISTGINQTRIVVRGFNDNLASSLLTLVDNRIASLPSIRLTALQLIAINNADIDRIEVVSGPASALYGPNSANGVVHIITKSPFESKGTTATVSVGENDIISAAVRRAGTITPRLGYKVFAQYYAGSDFEFSDSTEVAARRLAINAGADPDTLKIGLRDFGVNNLALQGRLDYRIADDGLLMLNAGFTRGDNIETSPTGSVQAENAIVTYVQGQLRYRRLFIQAFYNLLDSGDSYALRTGELFQENSSQFMTQVQHSSVFGSQRFTYGTDLSLTRPDSKGSVNGLNEEQDDINEIGAYLQSDTRVGEYVDLVAAARVDHHNRLDDLTFSPRAAVVLKPAREHTVRLTYNRAFQTPAANHLFADVIGQRDVFQGARLEPLLGFAPTTDLRAQGTPDTGFHFRRDSFGRTQFRSPYARLDPRGISEADFISLDDPIFTNVMWSVARNASVAGLGMGLVDSGLISEDRLDAFSVALGTVLPMQVNGVSNAMRVLDLERQEFVPAFDPNDIPALGVTRTETFEIGYKGIIGRGLVVGADIYRTNVNNFVGPFAVGTPSVFLDTATLQLFLTGHLETVLADPNNAQALADLMPLDRIPGLGNSDGSPASELSFLISSGVAGSVPFGTVSVEESFDPTSVVLVRRNFGDITLYGADFHFTLFASRRWMFGGSYSFMSDNFFRNVDRVDDIALNAPRHKATALARFTAPAREFSTELRLRYVGGFPVRSDVYIGSVDPYTLFDLSFHYRVPFSAGTQLTVTVQNLLDNEHREFVDVPEIGRLAMLRLTHKF